MNHSVIFFHGWSYHSDFFQSLSDICPNPVFYNRGYIGAYHRPILKPAQKYHAITHSAGLLFLCQDYDLNDFETIIIINGFSCFTKSISPRILKLMQKNLLHDATKTLSDFSHQTGDMARVIDTQHFNIKPLYDDLDLLSGTDIMDIILPHRHKIHHIHSENDAIMPFEKSHIPAQKTYILNHEHHVFEFKSDYKSMIQNIISLTNITSS